MNKKCSNCKLYGTMFCSGEARLDCIKYNRYFFTSKESITRDDSGVNEIKYKPAYFDNSPQNLEDGFYCHFCGMAYYNCLCSHEN